MAVIDRIKFDGIFSREWIVFRFPGEDFTIGTKLIVGEGQAAIFVKGGRTCDVFGPGTYTLSADNLPLLRSFVNLPFGGKTPFTAEVYFLNTVAKLDINWGTSDPIQLVDPKYQIRIHLRAFGQLGLKIDDYTEFFSGLIGSMRSSELVVFDKVLGFYKGILVTKVKSMLADLIINQKISALEVSAKLDSLSEQVTELLRPEFGKFGFRLVNFFIKSINFPEEDFNAINKILEEKARFDLMGDARYATQRSFDVYESAATNENGVAGAFAAGGMGLGVGAHMASTAGSVVAPPSPQSVFCPACHTANTPGARFCVSCGASMTPAQESKKCPFCSTEISESAKFCPGCGKSLASSKCECGRELAPGAKFCDNCGKKVE